MNLSWDPAKRLKVLTERGIDFASAVDVFAGRHLTIEDDREAYGEPRYQTYGWLGESIVQVVWTERDDARRIISMRKCNGRERQKVARFLG